MRTKMNAEEIEMILTTNLEEWKKGADIKAAQNLNEELTEDDISTICSPSFYDDIHDEGLDVIDVLDDHFMDTDLHVYGRAAFILMHDIYNV